MKRKIFLVLVLLIFNFLSFGQSKIIENKTCDTIIVNAIEISDIDFKFKIAIDDHLKNESMFVNKKKNTLLITINKGFPYINDNIEKQIDSMYDYTNFKKCNFDPLYKIGIRTVKKNSYGNYTFNNFPKRFYYHYQGWDIIFITKLNIEFEHQKQLKQLKFIIPIVPYKGNYWTMSVYEIGNYTVNKEITKEIYDGGDR